MRHFLFLVPFLLLATSSLARADNPSAITTPAADPEHAQSSALSIDPIGLVTGNYAVSATHVLGDHIAIHGDLQYTRELYPNVPNTSAWSASIGLPLYLDHPLHGPFAELGVVARKSVDAGIAVVQNGLSSVWATEPFRALGVEGLVGWQWTFRSGLHLSYAVGASRNWSCYGAPSRVIGEGAIRVGFAL